MLLFCVAVGLEGQSALEVSARSDGLCERPTEAFRRVVAQRFSCVPLGESFRVRQVPVDEVVKYVSHIVSWLVVYPQNARRPRPARLLGIQVVTSVS